LAEGVEFLEKNGKVDHYAIAIGGRGVLPSVLPTWEQKGTLSPSRSGVDSSWLALFCAEPAWIFHNLLAQNHLIDCIALASFTGFAMQWFLAMKFPSLQ
jgi:hypothetical protein